MTVQNPTPWGDVLAEAVDAAKLQLDDATIKRRDAQRAATWRRVCPDAFDVNGVIRPGALASVITRVASAGYDPSTGARRGVPCRGGRCRLCSGFIQSISKSSFSKTAWEEMVTISPVRRARASRPW